MEKEKKKRIKEKKNTSKKDLKKNKIIRTFIYILMIICIGVFCFSTYKIIYRIIDGKKTKETTKEIFEKVDIEVYTSDDITGEEPENNYVSQYWKFMNTNFIDVNLNELKQTNKDTKGWLQVPNTNVNYPFVQTNNNSYYLTHSFEGGYNECGWVFLDYRNNINAIDKNNIIYAHGNLDNSMFGSLRNVLKSNWYNNPANYSIKLSTDYANTVWEIFSIYRIPTTNDYIRTTFYGDEDFMDFVSMIKNRSIKKFNNTVEANDKILTLSTCYDNYDKIVIHAKLIRLDVK